MKRFIKEINPFQINKGRPKRREIHFAARPAEAEKVPAISLKNATRPSTASEAVNSSVGLKTLYLKR